MARYICPSCGEPFNGKKCKNCAYKVFDDIQNPEPHGRRGRTETPVPPPLRRPAPARTEASRPRRSRKPGAGVLVLLCLLLFLVPAVELLFAAIWSTEGIVGGIPEAPVPEPILTDTAAVIYSDDNFTIWADWQREAGSAEIPVIVENRTDRDVEVSAQEILLQGNFLSEDSFLYIPVSRGSTAMGTLYLDSAFVAGIGSVSFRLCVYDADTYDLLLETGPVTLTSGEDGEPAPVSEPDGAPVTEAEGVRVYCLGLRDGPEAEHFPDNALRFCLVNDTDQPLDFFVESAQVNGQEADLALWSRLPPHTMTYTTSYLFELEELGISRRSEVQSIQFHLQAWDDSGTYGGSGVIDLPAFTITP